MKNRIWLPAVRSRKTSLFRAYSIPYGGYQYMQGLLGKSLKNYPVIVRSMSADVYFNKNEADEFTEIILHQITKDPSFAQKHLTEFEKRFTKLVAISKKIFKFDFKNKTNLDIAKNFSHYIKDYQRLMPFMSSPHFFQIVLESKVKSILKKKNIDENCFFDLSIPHKQTFETLYQKDILHITSFITNNNKLRNLFLKNNEEKIINVIKKKYLYLDELLEKFLKKWLWITMEDYLFEPLNNERLVGNIKESLMTNQNPKELIKRFNNNQRRIYKAAEEAVKKLRLSKKEKIFTDLLQKYIWLRTARLEAFRKAYFYTKPLVLEIARRACLSEVEIYSLTPQEIIEFLKNNSWPAKKILHQRMKGYVVALIDGKFKLYTGEEWPEKFELDMGLQKQTSKIRWQKTICRHETPIRSELIAHGASVDIYKLIGAPCDNFLFTFEDGNGCAYFDSDQIQKLGEIIVLKVKDDPLFPKKHAQELKLACDNLVDVSQKVSSQKLNKRSIQDIEKLFRKFIKAHFLFSPYMMIPIAVEKVITKIVNEKLLHNKIVKGNKEKLEFYLTKLLKTSKSPAIIQEQRDFADLVLKIKSKKVKNYRKLIRQHYLKYRWLPVYSPNDKPYTLGYFTKKLKTNSAKKSLRPQITIPDENNDRVLLRKLPLEGKLRSLIELLIEYVYLRTYRVEELSKAYFYIQPLFKEIARRADLTLCELCLCSLAEIQEFLDKKKLLPKEEIERRKKKYLYIIKNGSFNNYSGRLAEEIFSNEIQSKKDSDQKQKLSGRIACRGSAIGRVRVVFDKLQISRVQKKDILVTTMTNPHYVIAMQKAAAIVTDEGGITCHAAIISREFNIPCIVGTGNATEVLKDGDLVKVDAEKGIVEIIERKG